MLSEFRISWVNIGQLLSPILTNLTDYQFVAAVDETISIEDGMDTYYCLERRENQKRR